MKVNKLNQDIEEPERPLTKEERHDLLFELMSSLDNPFPKTKSSIPLEKNPLIKSKAVYIFN